MYRLGIICAILWGGGLMPFASYNGTGYATAREDVGNVRTSISAILPVDIAAEFEALFALLGLDSDAAAEDTVIDAQQTFQAAQNSMQTINLSATTFAYRPLSARRSSVIHGENFGRPIRKDDPSMRDVLIYSHRTASPQVIEAIKRLSPDHHTPLQDRTPGHP